MELKINVIKPKIKVISPGTREEILKRIEEIGRVCYKSEALITAESASNFVRNLVSRGHTSVLEHISITTHITCDRAIANEYVRHRIGSYSQESTRYCNYSKDKFHGLTFILPPWLPESMSGSYTVTDKEITPIDSNSEYTVGATEWLEAMANATRSYIRLSIDYVWRSEQARAVLPLALKTEFYATMNLRSMHNFFTLRTAQAAHVQMRQIAVPLYRIMNGILPEVFDKIEVNYDL